MVGDRQYVQALGAFNSMDVDLDGFLQRRDLYDPMRESYGAGLSAAAFHRYVDSTFVFADADGDGRLSFHEWLRMDATLRVALGCVRPPPSVLGE